MFSLQCALELDSFRTFRIHYPNINFCVLGYLNLILYSPLYPCRRPLSSALRTKNQYRINLRRKNKRGKKAQPLHESFIWPTIPNPFHYCIITYKTFALLQMVFEIWQSLLVIKEKSFPRQRQRRLTWRASPHR